MPPIGFQSLGPIPVLLWPDGSLVSLLQPIPQWPKPNSGRLDGKLRWISDTEVRPIASRYLALTKFSNANGTQFRNQWFWFDLVHSGTGLVFQATSGKNGDTDFDFEIGHVDSLAISGLPGVYVLITLRMEGAPTVTEYHEAPDVSPGWPYNVNWNYEVPLQSIPTSWPFHLGDPWPIRWCEWYPVSECFPVSELTTTPANAMNYVTYRHTNDGTSMVGGLSIPWQTIVDGNIPTILDPGDSTKLVIPPGYSFARLTFNSDRTPAVNSLSTYLWKNGTTPTATPITTTTSNPAADQQHNVSSSWLPVVAGDFFQIRVSSGGGTLRGSNNRTWVTIELQ